MTRNGRDRFHTALSPERRADLEAGLLPADHPQLWSDEALERRYAQLPGQLNLAGSFNAVHGLEHQPWDDFYGLS